MRKPKGKLVALLAGAVVVVLVTVALTFWKDVYCHLFLDPKLGGAVGRRRRRQQTHDDPVRQNRQRARS